MWVATPMDRTVTELPPNGQRLLYVGGSNWPIFRRALYVGGSIPRDYCTWGSRSTGLWALKYAQASAGTAEPARSNQAPRSSGVSTFHQSMPDFSSYVMPLPLVKTGKDAQSDTST